MKQTQMKQAAQHDESFDLGRVGRILANNIAAAIGLLFVIFTLALIGDYIMKPQPSYVAGLMGFIVAHANTIAPLGFVAVTLPLIGQYSAARWER